MTLRVALSGNVAAGKSTVVESFRRAGIPVIIADEVAREVVAPGTPGLARIRDVFGAEVIAADGGLDRARLREIVFRDPDARRRLEAITHPLIRARIDGWLEERAAEGEAIAVAEIPLLFETGREADFDRIVFVDAPPDERLRRVVDDRGVDVEVARGIMAAQGDPETKRARSHHVIDNDGTRAALAGRVDEVIAALRRTAGSEPPPFHPERPAPPGWMRLDLHLHTRASWDCLSDPEAVLARARARGIDRIAITDHNEIEAALEMHARHPDGVIVGEEVKSAEGIDVIGLYLTEKIPRGTPAVECCHRIREQGGIAYLPHPYAGGKGGGGRMADELAALCEVVEVFNARLHPGRRNEPARALAARHGRLQGAGSDAHTVREVGGAWVEVPRHPNTAAGLRDALHDARVHGRTASNLVHLASTWAKIRKKLPGG